MGNQTSDKLIFKEIERELNKKQQERTLLFAGLPKSGKSSIINQIVNINKCDKNDEFIEYRYDLKSFTIKELTDKRITNFSSQSYKHLNLVCQFAPNYRITQFQFKSIREINKLKANNKALHDLIGIDGHRIDYELLLCGFIRQIKDNYIYLNTSQDIINLIKSFIKLFITSHKMKYENKKVNNDNVKVYDLWELPFVNRKDFHVWREVFQYVNALMFVCDISQYDEFYEYDKSINKLKHSMDLFEKLANDKQLSGISKIIFLNKLDVFKEKMEINKISLTECPVFSVCDNINGYNHKSALEAIKRKFKNDYDKVYFCETIGIDQKSGFSAWLSIKRILAYL